jgi:ABC-type sugar transport system substrate-binding protein
VGFCATEDTPSPKSQAKVGVPVQFDIVRETWNGVWLFTTTAEGTVAWQVMMQGGTTVMVAVALLAGVPQPLLTFTQ